MEHIDGNWFREENDKWSGYSIGIEVERILYSEKSEFQEILVIKSKSFGNVLVLDGVISAAERDEFAYLEMMANVPLNCHPKPEKVLVVGAGGGGVVKEVLKHVSVQKVVACEIDKKVVDVCKKYLPSLSQDYDDDRVELVIANGAHYMKEHSGEFDVIITDSCFEGPGEGLFTDEYFKSMKTALRQDGVLCFQGENIFMDLPLIKEIMTISRKIYPNVEFGYSIQLTVNGGHFGFIVCSLNKNTSFKEPLKTYTDKEIEEMNFKFYNTDIHRASFSLPNFVKKELYNDTVIVQ
ncbi:spermidine synthase-like [Mytilus trossulus]|uniref:spermidine synthase-like n=1 Tax=Mytilus trossulus TaxID=6551 RepID=UPI00300683F7